MRRLAHAAATTGIVLLVASQARADGALVLGVDGVMFTLESQTLEFDDPRADDLEIDSTAVSLFSSELGLTAGWAFDRTWLLGAQVGVGTQTTSVRGSSSTGTRWFVAPRFEWIADFDGAVRPGLSASVGVEGGSSDPPEGETTRVAFRLGAAIAMHLFATESFAVSPAVWLRWSAGSLEQTRDTTVVEATDRRLAFGVGLGLSGWIGGAEPDVPPPARAQPLRAEPPGGPAAEWQPSPPPEPEPDARPPDIPEDAAVQTLSLDGASATFIALPGEDVEVRLVILGAESRFAECALVVSTSSGRAELTITHAERPFRAGVEELVRGRTTLDTIRSLASAEDGALSLCDQTWPVPPDAREALTGFVDAVPPE